MNIRESVWQADWFKKLTGQMQWQQARVNAPFGQVELGTPRVQVRESKGKLIFDVEAQSDMLDLSGQATRLLRVNMILKDNCSRKRIFRATACNIVDALTPQCRRCISH